MPRFRSTCTVLASVLTLAAAGATHATPGGQTPPASFGAATPEEQLQRMTGGAEYVTNNVNEQTLNGSMSDTSAKDTVSGGNMVSGSAFGNSAGLPTVIQNSGNNVLIQNATIVNLRMNP